MSVENEMFSSHEDCLELCYAMTYTLVCDTCTAVMIFICNIPTAGGFILC
jgi:hypothetical protein